MKTKSLILVFALTLGLFTACTNNKGEEENAADTEIVIEEGTPVVVEEIDEAEKIRLDSLRQVEEHGHAH